MLQLAILAAVAAAAAASAVTVAPPQLTRLFPRPAAWPVPTPQQLGYQGGISALIHFNMATMFVDGDPGCNAQNWNGCQPGGGCNSSNPASFNPTNLNISQWIVSMKAVGMTHAVLTAKHGCGFLLWEPTSTLPNGAPYTYHSSMPVLEQFATLMQASGLGHGFYYSLTNNFYLNTLGHNVRPASTLLPGQISVTQQQYEDLSISLMTELWTKFGAMQEIWQDGGCGQMCDRVNALIKACPNAANAVDFNGGGGTSANAVRWCGTEGGVPAGYPTVWSTADCGWCPDGSGSGAPPNATGAAWYPSGVDVTLQQGDRWFFTPGQPLHSLTDLARFYHASVGANGHLEIDFAIDRTGQLAPDHVAAYAAFGAWIEGCYGKAPLASGALAAGASVLTLPLGAAAGSGAIDRVVMTEDQSKGQFLISYLLEVQVGGAWQAFSSGTTIGSKRIDVRGSGAVAGATALRFTVLEAFEPGHAGITVAAFSGSGCNTTAA